MSSSKLSATRERPYFAKTFAVGGVVGCRGRGATLLVGCKTAAAARRRLLISSAASRSSVTA
eukprot:5648240-Pyramimonas_sp.AAC.1